MSTINVNSGCHNLEVGLSIELSMALSHALLTALHESPCSGYDLAKKFDGTVGFFWSASHQQIYRELTKLEEQAYISAMVVQQSNRPDKKIYAVTEPGKNYLRAWIARPSTVAATKDELLVKLFGGDLVEPAVLLAELEHHRSQHQELLDTYKSIEQRFFSDDCQLNTNRRYQYLTLRQGIRLETEWLAWCAEAIGSFD
jgi:DNA-binding PadR family transcriptional regulator